MVDSVARSEEAMSVTAVAIRDSIIADIRASRDCADAAGVALADWGSITRPRVVPMGTVGAVNRGRIPMIEVSTESQSYDNEIPQSGGGVLSTVILRVHYNGPQGGTTRANADALMAAAQSAARSDDHTAMGVDAVLAEMLGVGWLSITAQLTIDNSYDAGYDVGYEG